MPRFGCCCYNNSSSNITAVVVVVVVVQGLRNVALLGALGTDDMCTAVNRILLILVQR